MSPRESVMTCARISVLHYVVPPVFTNSDKGKYKGKNYIKQYNTKLRTIFAEYSLTL